MFTSTENGGKDGYVHSATASQFLAYKTACWTRWAFGPPRRALCMLLKQNKAWALLVTWQNNHDCFTTRPDDNPYQQQCQHSAERSWKDYDFVLFAGHVREAGGRYYQVGFSVIANMLSSTSAPAGQQYGLCTG